MIETEAIEAFARDGAVCLRGCFAEWIETLREGVARNMAEPGPHAAENTRPGEAGRFFDDYCNWQRIPAFRAFVEDSPCAAIAAAVMGSRTAQFFHEHVLVKEPGTAKETVWHQDLPYYCVEGRQTVSFWLPLDPVEEATTLRFVAGSHRWPKLVRPVRWLAGEDFYADRALFMDLPEDLPGVAEEASEGPYRILAWRLEPGDAALFDFRTLHGARGNPGGRRRRAFSARWVGDDVRFCERPGRTSPPFPGIGQKSGERLRQDWFPLVHGGP